jgi:hypothetical protein
MKAVTTPCVRLVLSVAVILPYHTYTELARSVPTEFLGMVSRTESGSFCGYGAGVPLDTQSAFEASPAYLVLGATSSTLFILMFRFAQIGAGMQESSEWEKRGSQPPRQYAPTPHWPYSAQD